MSTIHNIEQMHSLLPFWEKLTDTQKDFFMQNAATTTHKKNASIHNADLNCIGLLYVCKGSLRVYIMSEDGREITLYRILRGEICVLTASCVLNSITFDVHVDAASDCELIQLCSVSLAKLMEENVYVEVFAYRLIAERFSDVMWTMQQILFMSFDRRLAIFLLDEASSSGSDEIHMTHEEIARFIGSAREVVTRMLKYFSNEGLVHLSRGSVRLLDRPKLRELV